MTKERQEQIKQLLKGKKDDILKAVRNQATYDTWDKHSPIYAYSYVFNEVEEITDIKRIEWLLKQPRTVYVHYFFNKEELETYKWMQELIENEVNNAIIENFSASIDKFVDYRDISLGDKNIVKVL